MVKLAQKFIPPGSGSPTTAKSGTALRDDDLESLPSVTYRSQGTLLSDSCEAPSKSRAHLKASNLLFF